VLLSASEENLRIAGFVEEAEMGKFTKEKWDESNPLFLADLRFAQMSSGVIRVSGGMAIVGSNGFD
jgi:hypothetical protein